MLTLALGRAVVVLTIVGLAGRRGSADLAQTLYSQHKPAASGLRAQPQRRNVQDGTIADEPANGPRPEGRPGKRERRWAAEMKRYGGEI